MDSDLKAHAMAKLSASSLPHILSYPCHAGVLQGHMSAINQAFWKLTVGAGFTKLVATQNIARCFWVYRRFVTVAKEHRHCPAIRLKAYLGAADSSEGLLAMLMQHVICSSAG